MTRVIGRGLFSCPCSCTIFMSPRWKKDVPAFDLWRLHQLSHQLQQDAKAAVRLHAASELGRGLRGCSDYSAGLERNEDKTWSLKLRTQTKIRFHEQFDFRKPRFSFQGQTLQPVRMTSKLRAPHRSVLASPPHSKLRPQNASPVYPGNVHMPSPPRSVPR